MKEQLQKQIGPFKLWQWLLIIVAGVGLGLLIRNSMANRTGPTTPAQDGPDNLPATQGAPTILQQDFDSIRTLQDEQDRLQDELDARDERNLRRQEEFFTDIRKRIREIKIPAGEKKYQLIPPDGSVGDPVRLKPKPKTYDHVRKEVEATGHDPLNVVNAGDVAAALRNIGRDPGNVVNDSDVALLQKWYKDVYLKRGN